MNSIKAIVLEKDGPMLTLLAADGSFQKVRCRKAVEIGAEIELPAAARQVSGWRIATGVAAVFLVAFIGIFGWNIYQPRTAMAMLSVDINPSLQLTLDQKGRVLEWESLNPDAEQVLSGLAIKGEPWEKALEQIISNSVDLNYLNQDHTWVVVGYSPVQEDIELPAEKLNSDEIVKHVEEAAAGKGVTTKVAVYQLTSQDKVQATENGMSLGEYALVDTAQKAGVELHPEEVKKTEERTRLLEKPEFQEQMLKDNRVKGNEKKTANVGSQTNWGPTDNSNKSGLLNPWNAWGMQFPSFQVPAPFGQNKGGTTDKDSNKNSGSQDQDHKNNRSGKSDSNSQNSGNQNNGRNGVSPYGSWGGSPYGGWGSGSYGNPYSNPYSKGSGGLGNNNNSKENNKNDNKQDNNDKWPGNNEYNSNEGSGKKSNSSSGDNTKSGGNKTGGSNSGSGSSKSNSNSWNSSYGGWGNSSYGNSGNSSYGSWGSNSFGR